MLKNSLNCLMLVLVLTGCSTIQYTPQQSADYIKLLEKQLEEAERDLQECTEHLTNCQPHIE